MLKLFMLLSAVVSSHYVLMEPYTNNLKINASKTENHRLRILYYKWLLINALRDNNDEIIYEE